MSENKDNLQYVNQYMGGVDIDLVVPDIPLPREPEEKKEQLERYYDSIKRASEHHKEVLKQLNNTEDTKDQ